MKVGVIASVVTDAEEWFEEVVDVAAIAECVDLSTFVDKIPLTIDPKWMDVPVASSIVFTEQGPSTVEVILRCRVGVLPDSPFVYGEEP